MLFFPIFNAIYFKCVISVLKTLFISLLANASPSYDDEKEEHASTVDCLGYL